VAIEIMFAHQKAVMILYIKKEAMIKSKRFCSRAGMVILSSTLMILSVSLLFAQGQVADTIQAGFQTRKDSNTAQTYPFDAKMVASYKPQGPTVSFRQLCYDYNWVGRKLSDIPKKFSRSDPAELAELSRKANMDAALILAVPQHGYTTNNSKYGPRFPALKTDWFGEVVK
jgi:hypothetical protein